MFLLQYLKHLVMFECFSKYLLYDWYWSVRLVWSVISIISARVKVYYMNMDFSTEHALDIN